MRDNGQMQPPDATSVRPVGLEHPTRLALLDAGLRLAGRTGLSQMSVEAVTAEAGVAKGTYYVHFRDRSDFLLQLYRRWDQTLLEAIRLAIQGRAPGIDRLEAAVNAYLDTVLATRAVRAILLAARSEPAIATAVEVAMHDSAEWARRDFTALKHPHPPASARLFVAMILEAALAETEVGQRDPAMREALERFARAA